MQRNLPIKMKRDFLKRWMSYFSPQQKFYYSNLSKDLEIRWSKGKKTLNTRHANYSYGGLQEVMNRGLSRIPLEGVESVLVLGMGGGCVVDSLRNKFNYHGEITGVEVDPVVMEIAKKEFSLHKDKKVQLIEADAEDYVSKNQEKFDLIIIDIFIDVKVPEQFYSLKFWRNVKRMVNHHGFVLFNAGIDLSEEKLEEFLDVIEEKFIYQIKFEVLVSNTVVILQKI